VIRVTRINSTPIVLNCDLIEQVQTVPDTMIALTNGKHLLVQESVEEIIERVVAFRRRTLASIGTDDLHDPDSESQTD
jgi:flagellar protein FlbD